MQSQSKTILERIAAESTPIIRPIKEVVCPTCGGPGIKAGSRQTSRGKIQRLLCRPCGKHFTEEPLPKRSYAAKTILEAITAYNLGRTIDETKTHLARSLRTAVPTSTIHSWLGHFADVCTFARYRKRYSISEDENIVSKVFLHKQVYRFKFHRLKANLFCKQRFPQIRRYLWHIAENCPNELFQEGGARCSDGNLPSLSLTLAQKDTNAVPPAQLGLVLAKDRRGRHEAIQRFMLANDSATIAVEVPVYLFPNEAPDLQLTAPLTGHIDVLQVRYDKVWILDYKPEARKEKRAKYQLYLYMRALSQRTSIPLSRFGLAYFDDRDYFEISTDNASKAVAA